MVERITVAVGWAAEPGDANLPEGEWQRVFTVAHNRATRQHFRDDDGNDVVDAPRARAYVAACIRQALLAALEAGWRPPVLDSEPETDEKATITIKYRDGAVAWWEFPANKIEEEIEPILGSPDGMRC